MSDSRSRHIPVAIARQLRLDARDRCCLKAHLIDTDDLDAAMEMDRLELGYVLNLHHLEYYSDGGEHTEENLMLVCPDCHSRFHNSPDRYPIPKLVFAKQHWIAMRQLFPQQLAFEKPGAIRPTVSESLTIPFALDTFNLGCDLIVPPLTTVGELAQFVGNNILRPAIAYSRTAPFPSLLANSRVGEVYLAFQSNADAESVFDSNLVIGEIPGITDNTLISMTDLRMIQALRMTQNDDGQIAAEEVTLHWKATPSDLDLHFFVSADDDRSHISYQQRGSLEAFPWARLSADVTTGHGPETVSFGLLAHGRYRIAVHNYSNDAPLAGSEATIDITIRDTTRRYVCPSAGAGTWWLVFDVDVDSGSITDINRISDTPELPPYDRPSNNPLHRSRGPRGS